VLSVTRSTELFGKDVEQKALEIGGLRSAVF
jgi:hypothetical protein